MSALTAVGASVPSAGARSRCAASSAAPPKEVCEGVERYERNLSLTPAESPEVHGLVYEQYADGRVTVLKHAPHTTPDIPSTGPDIPADAVKDNRVFIYVDGIHQDLACQHDQIHRLLQAPRKDPSQGVSADQPVIGIHEAAGVNAGIDGTRIALDLGWLKALQGHFLPMSIIRTAAFRSDMAVKSVHDEVKQSLAAGRDVQIALHSGGGAETALALNLIAREDGGRWKNVIRDHVRILALAPAASFKDFEVAGVKKDSIYYTASQHDPVYKLAHAYVPPSQMAVLLARSTAVGVHLLFNPDVGPVHAPDYIFWRNMEPDGSQPIQAFLDGGAGSTNIFD